MLFSSRCLVYDEESFKPWNKKQRLPAEYWRTNEAKNKIKSSWTAKYTYWIGSKYKTTDTKESLLDWNFRVA